MTSRTGIVALLLAAVVVDGAYWAIWFTDRSVLASDSTRSYVDFENAFPLADAGLALACLLAAAAVLRRSATALLWLLVAGGAAGYLLGMDVLYDLEHDVWFSRGAEGLTELAVNAATAVVAVTCLSWGWRHRDELLSGYGPRLETGSTDVEP